VTPIYPCGAASERAADSAKRTPWGRAGTAPAAVSAHGRLASHASRTLNAVRTPMFAVGLVLAGLVWVPAGTTGAETGAAECVRPTGAAHRVQRPKVPERAPALSGPRSGAAGPGGWSSTVVGRMPDATDCCGISRPARVTTATSPRQRSAGDAGRGWSAAADRGAGRPTSATCPALRTDLMARRSGGNSNPSATGTRFRYVFR
jgi:hypothetical protein